MSGYQAALHNTDDSFVLIHRFEPTDPRLGRHVHHDTRSLDFEFLPRDAKPQEKDTFWDSDVEPLNQGDVGSCTGNATAQWLNTNLANTVRTTTHKGQPMLESDALAIYSAGTKLDHTAGTYPPDDTGCSGIYVAKAGEKLGYLDSYKHTFSFKSAQAAVELTPAIQGSVWTKPMFKPVNGLVKVGKITDATVAGGHEYLMAGIDWKNEVFIFRNSWGDQDAWPGCKAGGYFAVSFADEEALLAEQGDLTILHGKGQS